MDYFTGEQYAGNCVISNFAAPLWKLLVFVKSGAIIPMTNPNNNVTEINKNLRIYEIYPAGYSSFTEYNYNKDEIVEVKVKGTDLKAVNALSFALPYDQQDYEFIGVEPLNLKAMENLTYDRLHTSGQKALYPTFVNLGDKETLEGTADLFILKLKAKRKVKFNLKAIDGLLVDRNLNMCKF